MKTLSQILIDANSFIDLTAALPTGDDLTTRINYAQQAVEEWASAYKWRQLRQQTTYFASGASHTLETNFRDLLAPPHETNVLSYPEIGIPEIAGAKTNDRYCYVNTNYVVGSTLILNGLSSAGATISYEWQRFPSNMATLTDICELPDPSFVTTRVVGFVLKSRLDDRFPIIDAQGNLILQNMIGREQVLRPGGSLSVPRQGVAAYALGRR